MTMPFFSPEFSKRYTLMKPLGHGAFASVFQARDSRNDRLVAVKHFTSSGGKQQPFFQELSVMMQLNHPNIVQCLDLFSTEENASDLILEFADRGSLRDHIEPGHKWDSARALAVLIDITRGLVYAHEQGIVHRDLKPENILGFSNGTTLTYKIADFGISKFIGAMGKTSTSVGSPVYMAPEQFYDRYGLKSDIYALGVMLFELLHNELPFNGSHVEIFKGHLEAAVPIAHDVPPSIADLLTRMMAKEATERPDASELLATASQLAQEAGVIVTDTALQHEAPSEPSSLPDPIISGGTLFAEMFGESDNSSQTEVTIPSDHSDNDPRVENEPEAPLHSSASDQLRPTLASPVNDSTSSELFFGEAFGNPSFESDAVLAPQPESSSQNNRHRPLSDASSDNIFGEGFDDAPQLDPPQNVMQPNTPIELNSLKLTLLWTRAADTKSIRLANLDNGQNLLMVTKTGVHELNSKAGKGKTYYQGKLDDMGTPSRGILPLFAGDNILSLQNEHSEVSTWVPKANIQQLCFAPEGKAAATVVDQTVYYHNREGTLCWSGDFGSETTGLFVYFESSGYLGVIAYGSDDQGIYLYSHTGSIISEQKMPGRIVAATRDLVLPGIWVIVEIEDIPYVLHADPVGHTTKPTPIKMPLRHLVGSRNWLCGTDSTGTLQVVDPNSGTSVPIVLEGHAIDYEHGVEEDLLYVLESRHDLLRYISVYSIAIGG